MSTGIVHAKKVVAAAGAAFAVAKAAIEKKPLFAAILGKLNYVMELGTLDVAALPKEATDIDQAEAHELVKTFYEAAK